MEAQSYASCPSRDLPICLFIHCMPREILKDSMLQCSLYFWGQEGIPKRAKIMQFVTLLTDKELAWSRTLWSQGGEHMASYKWFLQLCQCVFDHSHERRLHFKEGDLRATEISLNLRENHRAGLPGWPRQPRLHPLHPFTFFTNHMNLEYLKSAKRLNSRQAHWALFFTSLKFPISYWPRSKNLKADSLSCMYSAPPKEKSEECIFPQLYGLSPGKYTKK